MEAISPVVEAAQAVSLGKNKRSLSPRLGRGVPLIQTTYSKKCSCYRGKTLVFCRACGYYCNGRIRLICAVHPRVTFLFDISQCPRCSASAFLDEHTL